MQNLRWILAGLFFLFGVITIDLDSWKWAVLGLLLYSIPLVAQLSKSSHIRIWSLYFGVFLALQTFIPPASEAQNDLKTLLPNIDKVMDVQDGIPGISGLQHITTDEKGYRVIPPVDYQANNTLRIFTIGGSTTEDIYLDDKRTWSYRLQETLTDLLGTRVEVVNTGVSGLRIRHHLATAQQVIQYHPDMLIFMIGLNDWNHHIHSHFLDQPEETSKLKRFYFRETRLGRLTIRTAKTVSRQFTGEPSPAAANSENETSGFSVNRGNYYTKQRGSLNRKVRHTFRPDKVYPNFNKYLEKISSLCRENNIPCVFVTQATGYHPGSSEEFKAGFWMTPPNEDYTLDFESMIHIARLYNDHLLQFARQQKHITCDIDKHMPPSYDLFYDECHFNTKGAARVGDLIADCVNHYFLAAGVTSVSVISPGHNE